MNPTDSVVASWVYRPSLDKHFHSATKYNSSHIYGVMLGTSVGAWWFQVLARRIRLLWQGSHSRLECLGRALFVVVAL